jgi:asparagine synthase (glutamine-hydrolysing)
MCGIAGLLSPDVEATRSALRPLTLAQAHRGPDDSGETLLPFGRLCLGLGHRRLSILDLSSAGHQPMVHPHTGDVLVYNGEIYNFRALRRDLEALGETFTGHGDTEVLLHALSRWYTDALPRLRGMYALAFYRAAGPSLLLARDPTGIKPLYLSRPDGGLLFASEVRALLASGRLPRTVDPRGVATFLAYGAVQHPLTLVRGVHSLPPGAWQEFTPADSTVRASAVHSFWTYPPADPAPAQNEAVSAVRTAVEDAVRDHLVSDVPVSVFLSSGLDSTVVAGVAARHAADLHSFTVSSEVAGNAGEAALAAETARRFGLRHRTIPLPPQEMERAALAWLEGLDQPSIDGLNVYLISRAVRAEGIKVALSGLGGDELFGGYPSFRDVPRLCKLVRALRWLPAAARRSLAGVATIGRSGSFRDKFTDMLSGDASFLSLYLQRRRAMSDDQLASLGADPAALDLTPDFMPAEALTDLPLDEADPVHAVSRLESQFYQGNMLLRDADANSMAHGLEVRVPLLDQGLLEVAHRLPGPTRLPPGAPSKFLLRRAFADLLRPELLGQPKHGFVLPISHWMQGPLREVCEAALASLRDSGVLRPAGITQVWRSFLAEPRSPIWTRALSLCVLGAFLRNTGLSFNG